MRIGIIGAGNMGATLAAQLTRIGHQVTIANSRGPQTLTEVAARTGATAVRITEAASNADVVIVAIPEKNIPDPASLAKLGKPAGAVGRTVIPVTGDAPAAKSTVLELINQLGFDGFDAGPLAESWRQQPGTPVYTTDLPLDAARRALAEATPEQTCTWRSNT